MMARTLFQVADVALNDDGRWTHGYEIDALSCGRLQYTADICSVEPRTPTNEPAQTGYKVVPFAQIAEQEAGTMCAPPEAEAALRRAMDQATEYFVAHQFWTGDTPNWAGADQGMFLMDADIATVSPAATTPATIAAALELAYANNPDLQPIVHLGLGAALSLPPGLYDDHSNITFVEQPGYPSEGIAVTGPIKVKVGTIETHLTVDQKLNRQYGSATRLAAVEFDPCLAVVVA